MGEGRAARKRTAGVSKRGTASSRLGRLQSARWQAVLDNARDAIISIDRRGVVSLFNRSAEEIFGYSAEEILGKNVALLMPAPHRDSHQGFIEAYEETGIGKAIGHIRRVDARRKSGEVFPVELSVSEARLGEEVLYTAIVRDISQRLQIEEALRSERDFAQRLVDTAPVVVLLLDAEGRIVRFNPCMEEISGYRLEEVKGKDWFTTFVPKDDHERVRACFSEGKQSGYGGGLVNAIVTKQGAEREIAWHSRRLYDSANEVVAVLSIGEDITDRRRAERRLIESERRFSEFMRHLPAVAFIKALDGSYLYVNRTFEQLFRLPLKEVLGRKDENIWPSDFAERFRRNDLRVIETKQPIHVSETVPHDDGVHEWLSTKFPIFDAEGNPLMVGGVAVDVTEQKYAEAQLHELEKVTLRRERLADIGAITAQIVHDLGNPLAAISMQAQLILRRARRDDAQPVGTVLRPAEQIVSKVRDLDALIREFLDFAREQRLNLAPLDLHRFLQDIADLWHPVAAERGVRLTLRLPDANPTLTADEEKLRRVFENLLKNAVEAIDQGPGLIDIDVAFPVPDKVRISVTDTGPGIRQGLEVFRLFETTKPHGSGLGLPIVRQIVLAHGGGIEFVRAEPQGTVFIIDLPFQPPIG